VKLAFKQDLPSSAQPWPYRQGVKSTADAALVVLDPAVVAPYEVECFRFGRARRQDDDGETLVSDRESRPPGTV